MVEIPRKVYWLASLPVCALLIVIELLSRAKPGLEAAIFGVVVAVALMVTSFMLSIKRFHDRDKSGWFVLIGSIPVLGPLWLLIELGLLRGTEGPNRYGPDPLVAASHHELARLATFGLLVMIGAGAGVAYANSDGLALKEAAREPAVVVRDGTAVDLAVPLAAAYRVAGHSFAAEAAIWHSIEILETGIAGAVARAAGPAPPTVVSIMLTSLHSLIKHKAMSH